MVDDEITVAVDGEIGGEPVVIDTSTKADDDPVAAIRTQLTASQAEIESERKARAEETQRRQQAEAVAMRAQEDARLAREEAGAGQVEIIASGITAAEAEKSQAKAALRAAYEAGDVDAQTEAQDRLSMANAKILRLQEAKEDLDARKPIKETRQVAPSSDPVEIAVAGMSPQSAAWIRAHPDYVTDERKRSRMIGAHNFARADGLQPDTPQYFEHIEKTLGLRDAPAEKLATPKKTSPGIPVIPVNGGSSAGGGGNGVVEVKLSTGERNAATDGTHIWTYDDPTGKGRWKKGEPIGLNEMARRKYIMNKNGLYDRGYLEQ